MQVAPQAKVAIGRLLWDRGHGPSFAGRAREWPA